jgi:hypothetical protein
MVRAMLAPATAVSTATTQGIEVTVRSRYLPEQSAPDHHRYVFAYTIKIANRGERPAQLRTRHWIITDGRGGDLGQTLAWLSEGFSKKPSPQHSLGPPSQNVRIAGASSVI